MVFKSIECGYGLAITLISTQDFFVERDSASDDQNGEMRTAHIAANAFVALVGEQNSLLIC
jgi:hypothetical protein